MTVTSAQLGSLMAWLPTVPTALDSPTTRLARYQIDAMLKLHLPGNASFPIEGQDASLPWNGLIFPDCQASPPAPPADVNTEQGWMAFMLFDAWASAQPIDWSAGAVAYVTCGMQRYASAVAHAVELQNAEADLAGFVDSLGSACVVSHGTAQLAEFALAAPEHSWLAAIMSPVTLPALGQQYLAALASPDWIAMKSAEAASAGWLNSDWELYCHYARLLAMGVPALEIDLLIDGQVKAGLPVPENVTAGSWIGYRRWITHPFCAIDAISPAVQGRMLTGAMLDASQAYYPQGVSIYFLTFADGPGHQYWNGAPVQPWQG